MELVSSNLYLQKIGQEYCVIVQCVFIILQE